MKRLIIAILLFVIGCIIIGVIKQEYLIHKLLSQLSFNDSEVILYRIFSYSGYIVNIAISISVLLIISLLSFFVLMSLSKEISFVLKLRIEPFYMRHPHFLY